MLEMLTQVEAEKMADKAANDPGVGHDQNRLLRMVGGQRYEKIDAALLHLAKALAARINQVGTGFVLRKETANPGLFQSL